MKKSGLEEFGAYQKSRELFDLVVEDMSVLRADFSLGRLVAQQMASADSICANIEEGTDASVDKSTSDFSTSPAVRLARPADVVSGCITG